MIMSSIDFNSERSKKLTACHNCKFFGEDKRCDLAKEIPIPKKWDSQNNCRKYAPHADVFSVIENSNALNAIQFLPFDIVELKEYIKEVQLMADCYIKRAILSNMRYNHDPV